MRIITLEEHFVTASFLKATGAYDKGAPPQLAQLLPKLLDLGTGRIAAMDEAGISLQVLSLAAMGLDDLTAEVATPLVQDINDELASAIRGNPERLAGFATLALKDPGSAAKELERCVNSLGFKGALLDGTTEGKFLDSPEFLPIFEAAVAIGVPIYLHPAPPTASVRDAYFTGLPTDLGYLLSIAGWGWHAENGLHILRLIVSGLFDRLPQLQLIIGHMGEGVPYALARTSGILSGPARLRRTVADTFRSNVHVTTSGYFTAPPFQCALDVVGIDHLLYSVDYPFSPNTRGRDFLNTLTLSSADLDQLTHTNAEALLKL